MFLQIISEKLATTPAGVEFDIRNTPFFNIFPGNPSIAIFCADFFRRRGANSSILKDLEVRSGLFFTPRSIHRKPSGRGLGFLQLTYRVQHP